MPLAGVATSQILNSARTHLDDDDGTIWTDPRLMPKLQEAHRELQLQLQASGIPVVSTQNQIITIPPNPTNGTIIDWSTISGYPQNMVVPMSVKERQTGQDYDDFVDMIECDFLPTVDTQSYLGFWAWYGQTIKSLSATTSIDVLIRYRAAIPIPALNTDQSGYIMAESFLAYRTAALAVGITNDSRRQLLDQYAGAALSAVIRASVKQLQDLPAKRRAYHRIGGTRMNTLLSGTGTTPMANPVGWITLAVPGASSLIPDLTKANTYEYQLAQATTAIPAPNLYTPSGSFQIVITQDGVGGRAVTFDPTYIGVNPAGFDTTPNKSTVLQFTIRATGQYVLTAPPMSYATT